MIAGTYLLSGGLLLISAWLFGEDELNATTQTFVWVVIFFFASAGASAAYLTVSETWPIEIRAEAIAVFFAIAQIFGALGPLFYGALIGDGTSRTGMVWGYVIGGLIMVARRRRRAALRHQGRGPVPGDRHQAADVRRRAPRSVAPGMAESGYPVLWRAASPASRVPRSWADDGVDVTLVDRNDYHQFQPLLYQVASSQLPAEDIARPHRTIFHEHADGRGRRHARCPRPTCPHAA